jgi:hypothetical protein
MLDLWTGDNSKMEVVVAVDKNRSVRVVEELPAPSDATYVKAR